MKKFTILFLLAGLATGTFAQNGNQEGLSYCGHTEFRDGIFEDHPNWKVRDSIDRANLEEWTREYAQNYAEADRGQVLVIPTVVHIVHLNGSENISDDQVHDAIRILNEDFRAQNADTSTVVQAFKSIVADVEVEFRLAQKDPNGNCHKGITRTYSPNTYDGGASFSGHPIVDDVAAEHGTWRNDMYMNVFVCIDPNGAAGYTLNPSSFIPQNSMYGGIIISHAYFGSIGTGNYQLARSFTHEVGHWLNLSHTWGPNNNPGNSASCNDDDGVADTPNTIGWQSCNLSGSTCSSLDNVQNYMEYSYCSRMFTQGQRTRMRAALNSTVAGRNELWQTSNLTATGVNSAPILCAADFEASQTVICAGDSIDFTNASYHGDTGWDWTFTGGSPGTSTDENPTSIIYNTPGTYAVELVADDGSQSVSTTKTDYITVLPRNENLTLYIEDFEPWTDLSQHPYWFIDNPDNDDTWELTTDASVSGNQSVKINNTDTDQGTVDRLISSTFDLRFMTDVTLSFKYAYAQRNTATDDNLKVYVSNTCGATWSPRKNMQGTSMATAGPTGGSFVPTPSEWVQVDVTSIPSTYLTDGFRMMFEFTSDGGNNIYIDDINLDGPTGVIHFDEEMYNLAIVPNPSRNATVISFDLEGTANVSVDLLDMTGRKVRTLLSGEKNGNQQLDLNTTELSNGMYFVQLRIGDNLITEKLIVQ